MKLSDQLLQLDRVAVLYDSTMAYLVLRRGVQVEGVRRWVQKRLHIEDRPIAQLLFHVHPATDCLIAALSITVMKLADWQLLAAVQKTVCCWQMFRRWPQLMQPD